MKFKSLLILFLILPISLQASDKWKELTLPSDINTKQEKLSIPDGWQASDTKQSNLLSGITLFSGSPEEQVTLKSTTLEKENDEKINVVIWRLCNSTNETNWLSLLFSNTSIALNKQLPLGTKEVRVKHNPQIHIAGLEEIISLEYR